MGSTTKVDLLTTSPCYLLKLQQTVSVTIDKYKPIMDSSDSYCMHDLVSWSLADSNLTDLLEMIAIQPQS
jgi:hypothetical protein